MRAFVALGCVIGAIAAVGCGNVEPSVEAASAPETPVEDRAHVTPPVWDTGTRPAAAACGKPAPLHVHHDDAGRVDRLHVQLSAHGALGEFLLDTGSLKSFVTRSGDGTDPSADTTIFCQSMTLPIIARIHPGTTPTGLPQAGVLGADLVAHGSVLDLDLVNGHLEWYDPAPAPPARAMVIPIERRNGWLVASGIKVQGRTVKLIVDTGASNIIVVGKTPRIGEVREDTIDGTASAITLYHAEGDVDLGDGVVRHVPVDRTDAFDTLEGLIANLGGDVAGLLGLTALGRERVIIGESSMMVVLSPVTANPD